MEFFICDFGKSDMYICTKEKSHVKCHMRMISRKDSYAEFQMWEVTEEISRATPPTIRKFTCETHDPGTCVPDTYHIFIESTITRV